MPGSSGKLLLDPQPCQAYRYTQPFPQGGGFIAAVTDGLRWDAGAVQLRLLSGRFIMAAYDVPAPAVASLMSRCKQAHGAPKGRSAHSAGCVICAGQR